MCPFVRSLVLCAAIMTACCFQSNAQTQPDQEKQAEKEMYESIDKEVDRLANLLDLNDAQIFYVDSILTHDTKAMYDELNVLSKKKVSNIDMYYDIQYKWKDTMYYAFEKIFDEDQWAKYLKNGAERDKKSRDKKRAKSQK